MSSMQIENTEFEGLKIVRHFRAPDDRGVFIKPWVVEELAADFGSTAEAYFSSSEKGVLRGLHFQRGDKAQKKYVVCLTGSIEDIAVDMRPESKTYGKVFRMQLDALSGIGVIIPEGFAHGIFAHEKSTIVNFCDKPYSPGDEGGIIYTSIPDIADLPVSIVSDKDVNLPTVDEILA